MSSGKCRPLCLGLNVLIPLSNLIIGVICIVSGLSVDVLSESIGDIMNTVKPVCNDHLYNKIYYQCFIQ